jgi:MOSC domain-containing protein YiiM
MPCYKLGIRFGRPDIVKRFLQAGRTGFYFAVALEGEVGAGDPIELIARADEILTVADVVNLYTVDAENQEMLSRATRSSRLPEGWRDYFRKRLWDPDA